MTLDELDTLLNDSFPNVWFCAGGRTVHFGTGEDRRVKVLLDEQGELQFEGPGHLIMEVEDALQVS